MSIYQGQGLSAHFTLREFIKSHTANVHNIDNRVQEVHILANLKALCSSVLEPVRSRFGRPVLITSGYRCHALNAQIGGAHESQHMFGEAADFVIPGINVCDLALTLRECTDIPFDQLILEESGNARWIHISHRRMGRNRGQVFSILNRHVGSLIHPVLSRESD